MGKLSCDDKRGDIRDADSAWMTGLSGRRGAVEYAINPLTCQQSTDEFGQLAASVFARSYFFFDVR
jgi:hypothetical protein